MILALLALAGCGPASEGVCDELVPAPLAACFGGDGVVWKGYGTVSLTGEATVESVSTGSFPAACDVRMGGDGGGDATLLTLVTGAGDHVTVGLATAGEVLRVAAGDALSLDASYTFGEFGPDLAWIVLSGAKVGTTAYATAGSVAELHLPDGVTADVGDAVCEVVDECGDWAAYDLRVTMNGETATVGYGSAMDVAGWRVVHGGVESQTEPGTTCPDWYVAHAEVLLLDG